MDGLFVGDTEGDILGLVDGLFVGDTEGDLLGLVDGLNVGGIMGDLLGLLDGLSVGFTGGWRRTISGTIRTALAFTQSITERFFTCVCQVQKRI